MKSGRRRLNKATIRTSVGRPNSETAGKKGTEMNWSLSHAFEAQFLYVILLFLPNIMRGSSNQLLASCLLSPRNLPWSPRRPTGCSTYTTHILNFKTVIIIKEVHYYSCIVKREKRPVLNTTTSSNHTAKAKSLDPAKVLHTASVAAATSQFGWI